MRNLGHIDFWAKTTEDGQPGISVRDHCLNVGCVAEALRELLPPSIRALLPPEMLVLAAGHDIGKITVGFLRKCPAWIMDNGLTERANTGGWQFSESNHAAVSQSSSTSSSPRTGPDAGRSRWAATTDDSSGEAPLSRGKTGGMSVTGNGRKPNGGSSSRN